MEDEKLPIDWPLDFDVPSLYANQFAVAGSDEVVHITFGEISPPIITERNIAQFRERDSILVKPKISVVVSQRGYQALVRLLVNSLEKEDLKQIAEHVRERLEEHRE